MGKLGRVGQGSLNDPVFEVFQQRRLIALHQFEQRTRLLPGEFGQQARQEIGPEGLKATDRKVVLVVLVKTARLVDGFQW